MKWETPDLKKKWKTTTKNSGNSGPTPVARGGSGAKVSPLAARQEVNQQLLSLLSTYISVLYRVLANYYIKLSKILYHWFLSMYSFRFCETNLLHIKLFVGNQSVIYPFLGGIYIYIYTYIFIHTYIYIYIHIYICI